jgi:hypothetical protein
MSWLSELVQQGFGSKPQTVTQQPMLTEDQKKALAGLTQFGTTGSYGGYTAGTPYTGKLGDYSMSPLETAGQSKLTELLGSGSPEMLNAANTELKNLLTGNTYDPYSETSIFPTFKKKVLRETEEATDALKRSGAYTGGLYSTDILKNMGTLRERGQEQLSSKMAELFNQYQQNKINAIPQALNAATTGENIAQNRIAASQQYGQLQRMIADTEATRQYDEWKRQRGELSQPLQTLSTVAGMNVPWGTESMTIPGQSGWNAILDLASNLGGTYLGYNMARGG